MSFSWFISVDDHLIEPARLWQERVPAKWRDIAPRIVREGESEHWVYEDREIVTTGLNAVAGKSREEFARKARLMEGTGRYDRVDYFAYHDRNDVLDPILSRYLPHLGRKQSALPAHLNLQPWAKHGDHETTK